MDTITDMADNIKACRTCGIHFVTPSKQQLKHLFQSCQDHSEIMLIRLELAQWNIEVSENDGLPQYVCNTCIHKFQQVFQLRTECINAQNEFRKFYAVPSANLTNIKIKTEVPDENEESAVCDFIYVDELSDGEYDGATPFNIPHIPIKEELIEAAAVPIEDVEHPINVVESASESITAVQTDASLPLPSSAVKCELCHQISSSQEDHKHHMQVVHDIRDFECHICGKEFINSTFARLRFHMKWHNLHKQVKCNLCSYACNSKDALNTHKRTVHRKIKCRICEKAVSAKKIKSHMRQHELQQYPCEYCTKAFASEDDRETHIWQIHATDDSATTTSAINYQPCYTHQANDNILNLVQVENICPEPEESFLFKYICAHCERRFMQQIDLEVHVEEEHRGNSLKTFEPQIAMVVDSSAGIEKTPETMENLKEPTIFEKYNDNEMQLTNSNNLPLNSSLLNQGVSSPTAARFVCDDNYDTTEPASVTSDLSTYVLGDINTFACAKCSETFAAIEQLREHHEQHLSAEQNEPKTSPIELKKFQCNFCGKIFDLKFRLNRHLHKHKNSALL